MRRRSYLRFATASAVGLAGCTATALPGADDPASTRDCPALLDADVTVCPGRDGGPLTVERSGETVSDDHRVFRLAVINRAEMSYRFSPFGWSVFRRTGEDWARVVTDADIESALELAPGERFAWQLSTVEAAPIGADQRIFLDLVSGRYAVAVPFRGPNRVAAVGPFTVPT